VSEVGGGVNNIYMSKNTPPQNFKNHISSALYKNDYGQPLTLSETQKEIFDLIAEKKFPRNFVITPTQYGKSLTVATAVLTRVATFPEKWAIVAPSARKAQIIMGYLIDHIFDNEYTRQKFIVDKKDDVDRIRRERSKERINFKISGGRLGEVFTLTTEGKRVKNVLDSVMGFGAQNVVFDESSLVDDEQYAGVKRMVGGHKDNFILEIGNPFRRNHFFETSKDPKYRKIWIDYETAVKEGRFTIDFIEEMRKEKFFDILYGCRFPEEGMIDDSGWMRLLLDDEIKRAIVEERPYPVGVPKLGVDPSGGGGNFTSMVLRFDNFAQVVFKDKIRDTMKIVEKMFEICDLWKSQPAVGVHPMCFIDANGIGKGVYDRAKELRPNFVYGIIAGERASKQDYMNRRAEYFWRMREGINAGLKLLYHPDWKRELSEIRYLVQSERRIKIMSKPEMLIRGVESPDTADALGLTYAIFPEKIEERFDFAPTTKHVFDPYLSDKD
jgi:hypothetical protein